MSSLWLKLFSLSVLLASSLSQIQTVPSCGLTVSGGPVGAGHKCALPFRYNDIVFEHCTVLNEGNNRPWCPTKVDEEGNYFIWSDEWGYCDPHCPFLKDNQTLITTTTSTTTTTTTTSSTSEQSASSPTSPPSPRSSVSSGSSSGSWLPSASLGECGFTTNAGYIVGGLVSVRGEFPFVALLGYAGRTRTEYKCGGALINRRYVLTAAHCHVAGRQGFEIVEVVLGEYEVGRDPDCELCAEAQRFGVEEVIVHPDYAETRHTTNANDIALIRLDNLAVTVNDHLDSIVLPVCLDFDLKEEDYGELIVAGWGKTTNLPPSQFGDFLSLGVSERLLQKLKVPLVDFEQCRKSFTKITPAQMCAGGEPGKDSCNGDSGGPLVSSEGYDAIMYLVGIVSSGTKYCGIGKAGLYTKVAHYKDFIVDNLRP